MIQRCSGHENSREGGSTYRRTLFKRRLMVFSPEDEAILSEALHERYAAVAFGQMFPGEDPQDRFPRVSLVDVSGPHAEILSRGPG
jgi:hypothetical protein